MSANDWVSEGLGIIGIVVGVVGFWDGRRQRTKRHRSELIVRELIGRLNGFLVGIKPSVQNNQAATTAINDSLDAIKVADKRLTAIDES